MSRIKPTLPQDPSPSALPTPNSTHSFWHSVPSPLLTAHRSTRNLPEKADVVVIGSGMTGASVAHHLLHDQSNIGNACEKVGEGLSVVMLEAREACWGATGRNGGHCQPLLLEHPHDPSIPAFELLNFRALHTLINLKQIGCEFVIQPGVRAIYSLSNLHATEDALHILRTTLPEMAQLTRITRDENELAHLRVPGALGAVVTNVAARMWPYKFVSRILEDLITASSLPNGNFNLQTLTPVTALNRTSSGSDWQVCTDRGTITASKVVLATNAYTSHLLPALRDLIVPVRGQMSALHPLPPFAEQNRLQTSFGFAGDGIDDYLIQRPNETGGHLMFGGGRQYLPCVGETDDSVIDKHTASYLRRRLVDALGLPEGEEERRTNASPYMACDYCRRRKIRCSGPTTLPINGRDNRCTNCVRFQMPCGSYVTSQTKHVQFEASHEWTGIMGFSRDDLPWVGKVPASLLPTPSSPDVDVRGGAEEDTGLYIAAGYTGHGMPNTWLCGAAVAKMIIHPSSYSPPSPPVTAPSSSVPYSPPALSLPATEYAVAVTGLPRAYIVSEERIQRARELESVQVRDWAEMDGASASVRGGREADRPASGYA